MATIRLGKRTDNRSPLISDLCPRDLQDRLRRSDPISTMLMAAKKAGVR
jgi:hypothetical protein